MSDNIIQLSDFRYPWKEVLTIDNVGSTLQVYFNEASGELELVQMNDDAEAIRTCLSPVDLAALNEVVKTAHEKIRSNK